jgi:ppGpp synthetase/RelA/SpoT-type nucleotidyltranferase
VQVRAKAISSFAEKIQRKKTDHGDPVSEFTDLCGGRVITTTPSEVEAICKFIEEHFNIDWENSIDVSQRHKPAEFGYRSVHYIVQLKKNVFPTDDINIKIPSFAYPTKNCPMKAEIQVRTLLEHSWAVFAHDRTYKSSFRIPDKWQRELAAVAATLEDADKAFERIQTGLKTYASSYKVYMTEGQIREEIKKLKFILSYDPRNAELASRIGQLSITIGDWQKAVDVLSPYVNLVYQPALKTLGIAMCKKYHKTPNSRNYKQGQKYLESAMALDKNDADAVASLAGTWKGIDDNKAGELYRQAFELDPTDPYPLVNYLSYEIVREKDLSIAQALSPIIEDSIRRCEEQAEVGVNIPWAYYSMGKLYFLVGKPYESISAYAKAIELSTAEFMIDTSLNSLGKLATIKDNIHGYEWVRRLLILGKAAKYPNKAAKGMVKRLSTKGCAAIKLPLVIVAGGCDEKVKVKMQSYGKMLMNAFEGFQGTVISGGTKQGISGLVGDLRNKYSDTIYTIGYLPKKGLPSDATIEKDSRRYKEIRYTNGDGFSPLEPIQNWIDIIASGVDPKEVKVLGINGGKISAIEYKMALALGAKVAIIEESGREATKLLNNPFWRYSKGLLCVPEDAQTVRVFLRSGSYKLPETMRTSVAKEFHNVYQESTKQNWQDLREGFKESNLQAADHIMEKLRSMGYEAVRVKGKARVKKFTENEIEMMAEMEHGRWNVERLMDGWRWGEKKDVDKKINPSLIGWKYLPDDIRQYDRDMVKMIPEILASLGYEIRKK